MTRIASNKQSFRALNSLLPDPGNRQMFIKNEKEKYKLNQPLINTKQHSYIHYKYNWNST